MLRKIFFIFFMRSWEEISREPFSLKNIRIFVLAWCLTVLWDSIQYQKQQVAEDVQWIILLQEVWQCSNTGIQSGIQVWEAPDIYDTSIQWWFSDIDAQKAQNNIYVIKVRDFLWQESQIYISEEEISLLLHLSEMLESHWAHVRQNIEFQEYYSLLVRSLTQTSCIKSEWDSFIEELFAMQEIDLQVSVHTPPLSYLR